MKDPAVLVAHALECAERIERFTRDGESAFLRDELVQGAVLHNLQVMAQSIMRLPEDLRARRPDVDWRGLAGLWSGQATHHLPLDTILPVACAIKKVSGGARPQRRYPPGATETCNNLDDDCDGNIDEGFDQDGSPAPLYCSEQVCSDAAVWTIAEPTWRSHFFEGRMVGPPCRTTLAHYT